MKIKIHNKIISSLLFLVVILLTPVFFFSIPKSVNAADQWCAGKSPGDRCLYNGQFYGGRNYENTETCRIENRLWTCSSSLNCNAPGPVEDHGPIAGCNVCPNYGDNYQKFCKGDEAWERYENGQCNVNENKLADCPYGCLNGVCQAPTKTPTPRVTSTPTATPAPRTTCPNNQCYSITRRGSQCTINGKAGTWQTNSSAGTCSQAGTYCFECVPNPPSGPQCGEPCSPSTNNCPQSCSVCAGFGGNYTCQPPKSPTQPPVGGVPTPTTYYPPVTLPAATPTKPPRSFPTSTPGSRLPTPTSTPRPTQPPTSTPRPTATNTPVPTPTPDFNPAMCKCDQMDVEQIILGQPINVTAYAKVEGQDVTKAEVQSMKFTLHEGNPAAGNTRVIETSTQPVSVVTNTSTLVRYKSQWSVNPTIKQGEEYRIQAVPDCVARQAAVQLRDMQTAVLAERDEKVGFFGQIINFFSGLFGGGDETENQGVTIEKEDEGPLSFITNLLTPQGEKRNKLQLDTFLPAQMQKEACNIMKFKFDIPGQ